MGKLSKKLLVVSDSKFFIEAIKFIVLSSDDYSVESLSYKTLADMDYEPGSNYSIIFMDLDCCPEDKKENIRAKLRKLLKPNGKVYIFTFNAEPIHEAIDALIKTMHGDGLIRRPISLDKVLEALDL